MRLLPFFCLVAILGFSTAPRAVAETPGGIPENTAAIAGLEGEYLILVGGPALRTLENLRVPEDRHDRWWANFVSAANIRTRQFHSQGVPPSSITWLVFRPGYERRAIEEGNPLVRWIEELAGRREANLIWFATQDEMIQHINHGNNRRRNRIVSFDFFGHSNKYCFLIEYGSEIIGASSVWLHENELRRLRRSAFHPRAFCKSWGCHTAESMSRRWQQVLGMPLWGAYGKTTYVPTGQGRLPALGREATGWGM